MEVAVCARRCSPARGAGAGMGCVRALCVGARAATVRHSAIAAPARPLPRQPLNSCAAPRAFVNGRLSYATSRPVTTRGMAAPLGAAQPAGAGSRPACGELRVQLFLSLPSLDSAACVRARVCFGSGSGVGDSSVLLQRFSGAVVQLPLYGGAAVVQQWLTTHAASLSFESATAVLGEARLNKPDIFSPAAVRYPVYAPGAAASAPLGHVDVTLRLQLWSDSGDLQEPATEVQAPKPSVDPAVVPPVPHRTEVLPALRVAHRGQASAKRGVVDAVDASEPLSASRNDNSSPAPSLQSVSRGEAMHGSVLHAQAPPAARTTSYGLPPTGVQPSVHAQQPAAMPPQRHLPPSYVPDPVVLEPKLSGSPPMSRLEQGRFWLLCAPCLMLGDALDFVVLTVSQSSDEEQRRGGRRQLATLLLVASVLCSPNANEAWSLGTPGDWAVELRPARYAFAIWIVLYAGVALFAVFQAMPAQTLNPLLRRSGWHVAQALVALCMWAAFACAESEQRGMPPSYLAKCGRAAVSAGVAISLLLTLTLLIRAVFAIGQHAAPFSALEHGFVVAPVSLLAGWLVPLATGNTLTAATAVLALLGYSAPPVRGALAALAVAATGAGATLAVMRAQGNPWFACSVAWGLCAVAWNNTERGVHHAELHDPGAPLTRDDDVVFAAAVSAGVVLAASAVVCGFATKRKWGPRRGMLMLCDACLRSLRGWARAQSF